MDSPYSEEKISTLGESKLGTDAIALLLAVSTAGEPGTVLLLVSRGLFYCCSTAGEPGEL